MLISRIWRNILQCTLVCTSDSVETYVRIIKSPGWQIYLPPTSTPLAQGIYYTTRRTYSWHILYIIQRSDWRTYSGYTIQHGKSTQGILYNTENLLRVYFTTRRTYSWYTLQQGEPTQGILYNTKNLLRVYYTIRGTYSGYTIQEGEPTQRILYNKGNLLRVYYTTRRTYSGYTIQ